MPRVLNLTLSAGAAVLAAGLLVACHSMSGSSSGGSGGANEAMSFFVTSVGSGKGGDLGGLAGADRHCQKLAQAAGAGRHTWRAYLSTQPDGRQPGVNARDRIGSGPWRNFKGELIAANVAELHDANRISKASALTEKGAVVSGRADATNLHDMLTGSLPDGSFDPAGANATCANWTLATGGTAIVGHHDRTGLDDTAPARSWNSSHRTRGCSNDELQATGGAGLFYCFAAD